MISLTIIASPANAGAQLRVADWLGAALNNYDLRDWAPAFAGVGNLG